MGVLQDNLVLSTELILKCKLATVKIRNLTFRELALRRSERANALNLSFRISLPWPIYIINSVDKTKLSRVQVFRLASVTAAHLR